MATVPECLQSALACIEVYIKGGTFKEFEFKICRDTFKGDNYMGEIFRVMTNGKRDDGTKDCKTLIVKSPPPIKELRQMLNLNRVYTRECFMYSTMLPTLNELQLQYNIPEEQRFHLTKCYKSITEEYNELLIMEDLTVSGFKMCDRYKPLDANHLRLCIKELARYHATTFVLKEKYPEKYAEGCDIATNMTEFGEPFFEFFEKNKEAVLKMIENEPYYKKICIALQDINTKMERFLEPKYNVPYNILCHGDCWSNNILFKYNGNEVIDIRFIDWQIMREAVPVTDIYYMLFTSTDRKSRKECYREILDLYYETLSFNVTKMGVDIKKCYPESVYRNQLKEFVIFGLIMSVSILTITQNNNDEVAGFTEMLSKGLNISDRANTRIKEVFEDYANDKFLLC